MPYTLSNIVSRVQLRIRDTGFSTSEIKNYINDTQNDVFNEYRLPFMQTTQDYTLTANQADITNGSGLPSNFVQAVSLTLTSSGLEKVLTFREFREMDDLYPDYENSTVYSANIPSDWFLYGQTAKVFPEPNSAYTVTLRYYKKPTVISDDAAVPEIPSEFEELLIVGAAYRVLQAKDNYDQAGILQNKYDEILQKLVVKYSQPQVGRPKIMRINRVSVGPTRF